MPNRTKRYQPLLLIVVGACCLSAAVASLAVAAEPFRITDEARRHWAYQPVKAVEPPAVKDAAWARTPIDRFVLAKLEEKNLRPVGEASKLALIRRATFDLTGLPPTPEEVDSFLQDESSDAFVKVVERLLASPHYGERWGRHWLDLVRYADTAGETADFPAPHAWRYRNWVIDAFNRDLPYDEFLRQQLAGDILAQQLPPDAPHEQFASLTVATGYLGVARRFGFKLELDHYLTIEDTIDTVGKSLLGLTIACARCHDHKYDAISAKDYYALYGIFDSTRYPYPGCEHGNRPKDMVPLMRPADMVQVVEPHKRKLGEANATLAKAEAEMNIAAARWAEVSGRSRRVIARGGYDNGGEQELASGATGAALDSVKVAPGELFVLSLLPKANFNNDTTEVAFEVTEAGGMNRRWNVAADLCEDFFAGNPHADRLGNIGVWWLLDVRNGAAPLLLSGYSGDAEGSKGVHGIGPITTPVAVVNTNDKPVAVNSAVFGARSFAMHPPPQGAVAVAWRSPIDASVRVTGKITDADKNGGDGVEWVLEHFAPEAGEVFASVADATRVHAEARKVRDELAATEPKVELAYAVAEATPHDVPLQLRGDPEKPGEVVPRRFLEILGGQKVESPDKTSGRLQLAQWIASKDNPLAARVMVNRIWQHHFGKGLVKTPSDFGVRGEPPTHPELLDWLAAEFVGPSTSSGQGWSVKAMHRLIMNSGVYQLGADETPEGMSTDPANDLRWRFERRRLSAEEIRDGLLAVSGDLDRAPGGPHPFPSEDTWGFTQHAPFTAVYDTNQRSVYLMVQRLKRHPFLALFDGADPNTSTGERIDTTVPTQALYFMNDPFVHARSESLAQKLMPLADDAARLDRAYRLCFGRSPTLDEHRAAGEFLTTYQQDLGDMPAEQRPTAAWAAYLRVLFGSNEMVYVD